MRNLVFVGSEAEGYYGGAYDCFGVFVTEEYFDKYEDELRQTFSYRSHGELDGKYSDVEGDLVVVECNGISDVLALMSDKSPDYATYHYSEYIDYDDGAHEDIEDLLDHITETQTAVLANVRGYSLYEYMLTDEEASKVSDLIDEMRGEIK